MKTSEMREKLRRIFPEVAEAQSSSSVGSGNVMPMIKEEPIFQNANAGDYTEQTVNPVMYGNHQNYRRGKGSYRRGQRRSNNNNRNRSQGSSSRSFLKHNPTDSSGLIMTCDFCHSMFHFKDVCPDFKQYMETNGYGANFKADDKYI